MPIHNDHLPRLLVTLHDIVRVLREECFDVGETGSAICAHVEDWEQSLLVNLSPSITREKLLTLCRHAPSPLVLSALIMQQEALRTLSHNDYHAFLGGLPTEDAAFWNVEGDGYQAMEIGNSALHATWWPYHATLQAWADMYTMDILGLLEQAEWLLQRESDRQTVKGVIEPMLAQVVTLRRSLAFSNA